VPKVAHLRLGVLWRHVLGNSDGGDPARAPREVLQVHDPSSGARVVALNTLEDLVDARAVAADGIQSRAWNEDRRHVTVICIVKHASIYETF